MSGTEAPEPADKSEALAALSAGLAHDLNNVLSAVLMTVELLEGSCTRERERTVLAALDDTARRGVALVRQLRWIAQGGEDEETLFQPRHLLGDLQKAARSIFPASVAVASDIPAALFMLRGSPLRFYRLVLDLCLDAREGLAAGGELRLAAWNTELDEIAAAQRPGLAPGPHMVLEVAPSAGEAALPAAAAAAVEACGGFAETAARANGGQALRVYLPAAGHPEDLPAPLAADLQPATGEVILVAESDGAVREAIAGILEKHGYQVRTAADGAEAVALFARDPQAVAAVVAATDLPYLDGPGLLRAVGRLHAGVPAVLTGRAEGSGSAGPAVLVLAKPFTAPALLEAVRRALGGRE